MKVLFITNAYPTTDKPYYGIFIQEQIEYLQKNSNIKSKILILDHNNSLIKYLSLIRIFKTIKTNNPDIIHINYGLTGLSLLLLRPLIRKAKIVTTYHGSDINGSKLVKFISILVSRISSLNIAVSQQIFHELNKHQNNVIWLPCGINDSFLMREQDAERDLTIIFPSNPKRDVKNFPLFQKVISILKDKFQLNPKIIIFENLSREDIKQALLTSKCLLLTSKSEGSPQIVKEAIACNTPIVSTPVGDVPFLLKDLENCHTAITAEELAKQVALVFNTQSGQYPSSIKKQLSNKFVSNEIYQAYKSVL